MSKKPPKKPDLPKPRNFFPEQGPRWLKVEPARLATLGGLFFSTCVMIFYFIRQCLGTAMELEDLVLGVAKTFLVSYAGTGFFVWYMLRIAERQKVQAASTPSKLGKAPVHHDENEQEDTGRQPEESEEHP